MEKEEELKKQIDSVYKKFEKDYLELGLIMESGNYNENEMKKKYEDLDKKSGVNKLLEEYYYLITKGGKF